jgi:hypothetical protein
MSLAEVDQTPLANLIVANALPQNQEFSGINNKLTVYGRPHSADGHNLRGFNAFYS